MSKIYSKFIDEPFQGSKKMTPKLQAEIMAQVSIQCGNTGSDYLKNATKDASGPLVSICFTPARLHTLYLYALIDNTN